MFTAVQNNTKINRFTKLTINFYVFKSTMIKIHDRNKKLMHAEFAKYAEIKNTGKNKSELSYYVF